MQGPGYRHQVKIERSFTTLKHDKESSSENVAARSSGGSPSKTTSRKSSGDPRKLFSVPIRFVRRLSKQPSKQDTTSKSATPLPPKQSTESKLPDHISVLRRNQTGEALKQVTALLEHNTIPTIVSPISSKTFSNTQALTLQVPRRKSSKRKWSKDWYRRCL